jgi:hypothetical protein
MTSPADDCQADPLERYPDDLDGGVPAVSDWVQPEADRPAARSCWFCKGSGRSTLRSSGATQSCWYCSGSGLL